MRGCRCPISPMHVGQGGLVPGQRLPLGERGEGGRPLLTLADGEVQAVEEAHAGPLYPGKPATRCWTPAGRGLLVFRLPGRGSRGGDSEHLKADSQLG